MFYLNFHWHFWLVIGLFFLAMILMGVFFAFRQKTTEDYFVANHTMPWAAVGLSTIASLTSTITYIALPGEIIKNGFGYLIGLAAMPLIIFVVYQWTLPFLMKGERVSLYQYLEHRFDKPTRLFGVGIVGVILIGWMATVTYTAANALAPLLTISVERLIFIFGSVAVLYTLLGGIRADIWTDVIQSLIMLLGVLVTLGYIVITTQTGPVAWWNKTALLHHAPPVFSFDPTIRISAIGVILNMAVWWVCTLHSDQMAAQRFFTLASLANARRAFLLNIASNIVFLLLLGLCGAALFSFYAQQTHLFGTQVDWTTGSGAEAIFPYFITHQLPPLVSGLVVAALLAAAMSTLDSGINSLATITLKDFFKDQQLQWARLLSFIFGFFIMVSAVGIHRLKGSGNMLFDIQPALFNWGVGPLGGMFLAGLFLPRATSRSVIPATLIGSLVGLLLGLLKPLWGISFSFAWVIPYSFVITLVIAWVLSRLEKGRGLKNAAILS